MSVCVRGYVVVWCALGVWVSNFLCGAWVGWLGRRPPGHRQPNITRRTLPILKTKPIASPPPSPKNCARTSRKLPGARFPEDSRKVSHAGRVPLRCAPGSVTAYESIPIARPPPGESRTHFPEVLPGIPRESQLYTQNRGPFLGRFPESSQAGRVPLRCAPGSVTAYESGRQACVPALRAQRECPDLPLGSPAEVPRSAPPCAPRRGTPPDRENPRTKKK